MRVVNLSLLCLQNPDPKANKYFSEFITKAYEALTDEVSRQNFEKYGHPDGPQVYITVE
jgi:translocation protein SEC63